jgi:tetratricopeptide (TPR) repeat protein
MTEKNFAQTLTDAIEAFNAGAEAINAGETADAIEKLENAIKVCDEVGSEADEHKIKAQELLPNLYYGVALDAYKAKQMDDAIKGLEKTIEKSQEYGDSNTEEKAKKNLPKFYYAQATEYYKAQDFVNARPKFLKAVELSPEYINAYFYLALSEKNLDNEAGMIENFNKIIEIGPESNSTVKKTIQTLGNHYENTAKKAINSRDFETAASAFENSLNYKDATGDTYYYIAMSYNNLENWDKAIENGVKAVEMTTSGEEAMAKANYELAKAYEGKGDKENACAAYTKAAVGRYEESAKYQMEQVLKCGE